MVKKVAWLHRRLALAGQPDSPSRQAGWGLRLFAFVASCPTSFTIRTSRMGSLVDLRGTMRTAPQSVLPRPFGAHKARRANRAGYVLVMFVMMFLCLMAVAALVIDMGFARLAQRQMRSATDSAALEGLRWRDVQQWEDLPPAWLADPNFQKPSRCSGHGLVEPAATRVGPPLGGQPGCCRRARWQWIFRTAKPVRRLLRGQWRNGALRRRARGEFQRLCRTCRTGRRANHDDTQFAGIPTNAIGPQPRSGTQSERGEFQCAGGRHGFRYV